MLKEGSLKMMSSHHGVSFLLGAALPTVLFFLLASDRVGEQLSSVSGSWLGGNGTTPGTAPASPQELVEEEKFPGLAELLIKVATNDKIVIITSVNEAWARPGSLLDLFLAGFKNGEGIAHLINHTLIIAVDPGALAHCKAVHLHCYLHEVTSMKVSSANRFMTKSYLELVWAKLELPERVLQLGYNYLFTDVDIIWFRNPFRHISLYADMAISTDGFNGDSEALTNTGNTGFYYIKSMMQTVEMLKRWREGRSRFPSHHDQEVFNRIKTELATGELQIKFVFFETTIIGDFCQFHEEMDRVCTMHANCCIGLENKLHDLRNIAADWKNYTSLAAPKKRNNKRRWTTPTHCKASMRKH